MTQNDDRKVRPNASVEVWDTHLRTEFAEKDPEATLRTMTATPRVNLVPLMVGASNLDEMRTFYSRHFLNQLPPDLESIPVSRTVGEDRVVDEMVLRFTHSIQMDWLLPGVPPTHRRIEVPLVAIIQFEDGKIAQETIYFDTGTVMLQVGLIDGSLPVRGAECARQVLDPVQPMNELIRRAQR
ncbi:nuclear transport factor 2 family protein [Polyangium sp. 15x6]|uniref:ester cyclase n=1 Tax=Polyangium sp. 15x6 TaxID=3042687 RepID=UPI002499B858|nr:nuclear transport factor 2 family protein [Polyangium sp. 15x6]MDI3286736.1 nuclear transport factor 2 family protein [Polyangium sp. 15x6]